MFQLRYFIIICVLTSSYFVQAEVENLAFGKPVSSTQHGRQNPELAVDGKFGQTYDKCAHTAYENLNQKWAWWQVNLQQTTGIKNITIYYRNESTLYRFNGFQIVVGIDDIWQNRTICYKDMDEGIPPAIVTIKNCTGPARYITISNENVVQSETGLGPILELCEVQIFGCASNTYGEGCQSNCHCKTKGCNYADGICFVLGCEVGWKGDACNQACELNNFGENCNFTCHCLTESCPPDTGICKGGCHPGWLTETCSQSCVDYKFGKNCKQTCHCNQGTCNNTDGRCFIQGCKPGWEGYSCSTPCKTDNFGIDCTFTCHCLNGSCPRDTGLCNGGCQPGWLNKTCSQPCVKNKFGENCKLTCHCKEGICNNTDGRCFIQGCKPGWQGNSCSTQCENGTFGSGCERKCYCLSDTCHNENGKCGLQGCKDGWTGDTCSEKVEPPQTGPEIGIAVGVVVAVIVIAAVVVVLFVYRRRRLSYTGEKKLSKFRTHNIMLNSDTTDAKIEVAEIDVAFAGPRNRQSTQEELIEYANVGNVENVEPRKATSYTIEQLRNKLMKSTFKDDVGKEYKDIKDDTTIAYIVGEKVENRDKNRFRAIYPYDHSRVVLETLPGDSNSDYINANYIDGVYHREKSIYVATQGPKTKTVIDFWRMIWQIKSGIIVMLTNPMEKGKAKCYKYWPDVSKYQVHGDLKIELESEIGSLYFTNRKLKVTHKKTGERRYINHLHFTTWPDHGTPDPTQLVLFHRSYMQLTSDLLGPPVVHCSAGIGRTGTFIALDALYRYGKENGLVDIFEYVKVMRKNRMTMVQTEEQYIFLYESLLECFDFQETSLSKDEFIQFGNQEKRIKAEFTKLVKNIPTYDKTAYTGGNKKYNQSKNRNQNILPVDKFRPYLMSHDSTRSNYINAVIVPSYKEHTGYLVTQFPLDDTVVDFWCLVFDHDSPTVVTLDCSSQNEKKINWMPTNESDLQIGKMTLRKTSDTALNGDTKETELMLVNKDNERSVKVYEVQSWRQGAVTPSSGLVLLNLIQMVEHWKTLTDGPITVVCMDGAKCCGLFCGLYTILQKIRHEDSVDIYQTVKQLQVRRPEFFSSIEQYQFLYGVVRKYIENANIYVN
ncbi:hypothetical protein KUTeg_009270 [Tegillarca granosa]|uniref:protein-tyrosine-phosphatase n=1 Tax=Tegillarca granosa TaxID=220873 RepID=A0ABQ9F742_TEGGR|nr:hypothetical protein KUTeg_009270 [Tegillarca granosa]